METFIVETFRDFRSSIYQTKDGGGFCDKGELWSDKLEICGERKRIQKRGNNVETRWKMRLENRNCIHYRWVQCRKLVIFREFCKNFIKIFLYICWGIFLMRMLFHYMKILRKGWQFSSISETKEIFILFFFKPIQLFIKNF